MTHRYFLLSLVLLSTCSLWASNKYVTTSGDDDNDGNSWTTSYETVQKGVWNAGVGDTVFVAEGTYMQTFSVTDGVHVFGGYQASSGVRNVIAFPTIIDGTDQGKWIFVKYDNGCTNLTVIDGITFQNAEHTSEGGCAYIRTNMVVNNCVVRNCQGSNGGAFMMDGTATVSNCTIELCSATSSGGAIRNKGGIVENCIIRGCQGKYGTIRNDAGTVRNCVLYNNEATVSGWPNSGGIYNPGGQVINCTLANNKGEGYAGIHSDSQVINTICWGNQKPDGFADPENYIASGHHNAYDHGFGSGTTVLTLGESNLAANGPHFVAPTTFKGIPTTAADIAAMRAADFRLAPESPCLNIASATDAPSTDILGVARPKGTGADLGAYEYDPNAAAVAVTGVSLTLDTLRIEQGDTVCATAIVMPGDATDKSLFWSIANSSIATCNDGCVVGLQLGTTTLMTTTMDGGFSASCVVLVVEKPEVIIHPEVLMADTLYPIANYTVPSFIPFWAAKEAARRDSTAENLQAMRDAILTLVDYRTPYDICANINGDPRSRMAFAWFTNEGVNDGVVEIKKGIITDEAQFAGATQLQATATATKALRYAVSTSGIIKATGMSNKQSYVYTSHKAIADGLDAGSDYSYRVGFAGHWSEIRYFTTADGSSDAFKFLIMSDSHIMDQEYVDNARWCANAAAAHAEDAKFCLFPGDFVETGTATNSEWEWEQWFNNAMLPVLQQMPVVPTDGNHDDSENLNYTYHFNTDNAFNLKAKVKPQFDGITYSFVYGDALFLVYSHQDYWRGSYSYSAGTSTYLTNDVANWFREQVAENPNTKWRIAVVHKNLFCGSGHQEDEDGALFRATLLPVFKELHIDLALQGHDHTYEVMGPVDPDTKTVVAGAVSGVETVPVNTNTNMTGLSGGTFNVDNGTLYYVGATCGRKRYYPYTRAQMDANYDKTKVTNYYDLFTSRFGQPGAPTYSEVSVSSDSIIVSAYMADSEGGSELFNSIRIVSSGRHSGLDKVDTTDGMLYPVPAVDYLVAPAAGFTTAEAITLSGEKMTLDLNDAHIDVSPLASGIYLLRLGDGQTESTYKFIKK